MTVTDALTDAQNGRKALSLSNQISKNKAMTHIDVEIVGSDAEIAIDQFQSKVDGVFDAAVREKQANKLT